MLLAKLKELKNYVKSALLGAISFAPMTVLAEQEKVADTARSVSPAASETLLPMLLALLFIVALIFALAFLAKRFNITPMQSSHIKLVSSMSLGGRERIIVIEIQGKQHALGVTQQSVNHLFELEEGLPAPSFKLAENSLVNRINKVFGYTPPEQASKSTEGKSS